MTSEAIEKFSGLAESTKARYKREWEFAQYEYERCWSDRVRNRTLVQELSWITNEGRLLRSAWVSARELECEGCDQRGVIRA